MSNVNMVTVELMHRKVDWPGFDGAAYRWMRDEESWIGPIFSSPEEAVHYANCGILLNSSQWRNSWGFLTEGAGPIPEPPTEWTRLSSDGQSYQKDQADMNHP